MIRQPQRTRESMIRICPGLWRTLTFTVVLTVLAGCAHIGSGSSSKAGSSTAGVYQSGDAAYYAARFDGRRTASGEIFDSNRLTAAHRTLPLGSHVRVTNLNNGRQVDVRINDRGPFTRGRIIDLSRRAATRLDMIRSGVAPVELRLLDRE